MMDFGVLAPNRVVLSDSALIALFGEVLLTDIGILSALLRSPRVAQLPGVAADLSPEELGVTTSVPGSPEVYTLGVAFWQLLTNRWIQLPQGGPRARHSEEGVKDSAAQQSIPPVDSVERMGLPVPEPVARILRQATHSDPRRRFTSLDALVAALEQLPSNLVATSSQLRGFIHDTATQFMPECAASATWTLPPRFDNSRPPPSRPIDLHPNGGHDWEPPTLAERRLVAPVMASGTPHEIELDDEPV
jgi:serine/threonine protein kinase